MTHADSSSVKPAMTDGVSILRIYYEPVIFCSCHISQGTSETLASVFMHDLSLKQSSITELNMQKLFIHRRVFWEPENSLQISECM